MDESRGVLVQNPIVCSGSHPSASNGGTQQTPEELVARAIAPVKREFLRPPPVRPSSSPSTNTNDDVSDEKDKPAQSAVDKEKKSKRQLKRERRQVFIFPVSI